MTNNPGAAGGALTDYRGTAAGHARQGAAQLAQQHLAQLRHPRRPDDRDDRRDPLGQVRPQADRRRANKSPQKPLTLDLLGLVLVPDVLERTPPFVDEVRPGFAGRRGRTCGPTTWCCSSTIAWCNRARRSPAS